MTSMVESDHQLLAAGPVQLRQTEPRDRHFRTSQLSPRS